jgi:AcrR family transcriptional regulator
MGIAERRAREREQRRREIMSAAWDVAERVGWARFSVEQVATAAELGRATVYGYFASQNELIVALANEALEQLSTKLAEAPGLREALEVPVRFAQANPPAFALLFPSDENQNRQFASPELEQSARQARELITRLTRLAERNGTKLPLASNANEFLSAVAMAGVLVPELRASTTLRRRWQDFCLGGDAGAAPDDEAAKKADD